MGAPTTKRQWSDGRSPPHHKTSNDKDDGVMGEAHHIIKLITTKTMGVIGDAHHIVKLVIIWNDNCVRRILHNVKKLC